MQDLLEEFKRLQKIICCVHEIQSVSFLSHSYFGNSRYEIPKPFWEELFPYCEWTKWIRSILTIKTYLLRKSNKLLNAQLIWINIHCCFELLERPKLFFVSIKYSKIYSKCHNSLRFTPKSNRMLLLCCYTCLL